MAIHDVNPTELIVRAAGVLEKEKLVQPPEWAEYARTGRSRERPPAQDNWWFIRSASIMRKLFVYGPVGTSKLRMKFGGRKNMGVAPERFFPSAGNHIRKILQQLEKSGLARQTAKGTHKGRVLTPKGQQLLEGIAAEIMKEKNVVLPKIPGTALKAADEKPKKKARKKKAKKAAKKAKPKAPAAKPKEEKAKPAEKSKKEEPAKKPAPAKEEKAEKPAEPKKEEKPSPAESQSSDASDASGKKNE